MGIPQQVLDQEKEVEELLKKGISPQEPQLSESEPESSHEPELVSTTESESAQEPESGVESEQVQEPEPKSAPEPSIDWEQKYKVLQGKYDAEVPRLQQLLGTMSKTLEILEKKVEAKSASEPEPKKEPDPSVEVLSEFEESYPSIYKGVVSLVNKLLKETVEPKLNTLETNTVKAARNSFEAQLSKSVENWRTVNTDPKFLEWLGEEDGLSGRTRHESLMAAYNVQDAERVAKIFKAFLDSSSAGKDSTKPSPPISPPSRTSPSPVPPSKATTPSEADIVKITNHILQATRRGDIKLADKLNRELDKLLAQTMTHTSRR